MSADPIVDPTTTIVKPEEAEAAMKFRVERRGGSHGRHIKMLGETASAR
jgi:hypothetical protein